MAPEEIDPTNSEEIATDSPQATVKEKRTDDLPPAPDGGWGWVVVFGSFMVHVIADGIAYSFGIYVTEFIEYFECSRSEVGWLGSLMIGVTWGAGPIASVLVNKFGCRVVAILGTLIAAVGFIISIFAPNIYFMYFSFGIVAGIGLGLAYLPAIVAVSFYFEKRRSLATGLAVCGSGVGTFLFAPITQALLEEYSWKGTVLIETGLMLNVCLCGLVFRPLPLVTKNTAPKADNNNDSTKDVPLDESRDTVDDNINSVGLPVHGRFEKQNGTTKPGDNNSIIVYCADSESRGRAKSESWMQTSSHQTSVTAAHPTSKNVHQKLPLDDGRRRTHSESVMMHHARPRNAQQTQQPRVLKMMARKDVFYTQSLDNIPLYKANPSMYHNSISMLRLDAIDEEEPKKSECCGEEARRTLQELMDFRLFLDVVFVLFAVSNLLTSIGFVVPYIFLPERGVNLNLSDKEIPWLISAIGISNTIGRVLFGYIADFKCINRLMLYNTVLVLCGLVSIFSYLCYNFALLMVFSFLFGCMIGIYTCLTPIVLVDLLGLAKLSNAFGLVLLMGGIGAVVGPPAAGAIFDATNDYDNSFFMMGACILLSGLMLYPVPFIQRMQSKSITEADIALGKLPQTKLKTHDEEKRLHETEI